MIMLDTHVWIWLHTKDGRLSKKALDSITAEGACIAGISLWEVSMLAAHNRIKLDKPLLPWLKAACAQTRIRLLPLTPEIAALSVSLELHGDPSDRIIVATAFHHSLTLATADGKITKAALVPTIW